MPFHEALWSASGELTLSMTASPRDLVSVTAGLGYLDGYQASPYRFVVYDHLRAVDERLPRERLRATLLLRWNRHLFEDTALRTQLRGYRDDWGVASVTAGAAWVVGLGALELDLHLRGYAQRGADFYRASYDAPEVYMTSDRELSRFVDGFAGASLSVCGRRLRADVRVDGFGFLFDDFAPLSSRTGLLVELGATLEL